MNAIILACSSLQIHIDAAQTKMKTSYPMVLVDRKYHKDPKEMRRQVIKTIQNMHPEVDTILVAMGFCGGSWDEMVFEKRIVIPKVDDCITVLLHTDDEWHPNLKKAGHFYLSDSGTDEYSPIPMQQELCEKCGEEVGMEVFHSWFQSYTDVDIIDTGEYDCYAQEYVAEAQKNADLIRCQLNYVKGSNLLLEKLVSGRWDQQFLVAEPGQLISYQDFVFEI